MIENEELKAMFSARDDVHHVEVAGDGYHYEIVVVSDVFEGKRQVGRQQWVYALINDWIANGSLHAITIKTYTMQEWEKKCG